MVHDEGMFVASQTHTLSKRFFDGTLSHINLKFRCLLTTPYSSNTAWASLTSILCSMCQTFAGNITEQVCLDIAPTRITNIEAELTALAAIYTPEGVVHVFFLPVE